MSQNKNHDQLHLFDIPNPCVGICQTGERGYCVGCFRKREERFGWLQLDDAQKLYVLKLCEQRRKRASKKQNNSSASSHEATQATVNTPLDLL